MHGRLVLRAFRALVRPPYAEHRHDGSWRRRCTPLHRALRSRQYLGHSKIRSKKGCNPGDWMVSSKRSYGMIQVSSRGSHGFIQVIICGRPRAHFGLIWTVILGSSTGSLGSSTGSCGLVWRISWANPGGQVWPSDGSCGV